MQKVVEKKWLEWLDKCATIELNDDVTICYNNALLLLDSSQ